MHRIALGVSSFALAACSFNPGGAGGPCTPGCDGAELTTCPGGADGEPMVETCAVVCAPTPAPHCGQYAPANLATVELDPLLAQATASLTLVAGHDYTVDTDTRTVTDDGGAAVDLAGMVFMPFEARQALLLVDSLTVPAGVTLTGRGTRALIVVARRDIEVDGAIDFAPGCELGAEGFTMRCGGPGGGNGGKFGTNTTGCAPGFNGSGEGGGAGGGFGSRGGDGGPGATVAHAASLDGCPPVSGNPLVPLIGGSGGGAGASGSDASGGGGGGAIQLTALGRLRLAGTAAMPATIFVGGAGGGGSSGNHGGGGGGAGGGILLEGATVELDHAALIATGGGGGGGRNGSPGADAMRDGAVAAGGAGSGGAGDGGDGAVNASAAEAGFAGGGASSTDGGGGGGGGLGRIRIDTPAGTFAVPATSVAQGATTVGVLGTR